MKLVSAFVGIVALVVQASVDFRPFAPPVSSCQKKKSINTFDSDQSGFLLAVCQQTGSYVEQLDSWFDAGQVALFPIVLSLFPSTCVPEPSNLRLLCPSVSVKMKRLLRWSE